ncbi:peptidylprolyl isomerase [Mesobacillus foraminis]|uniref:peptidylprolyl isomerase n=1 Tax=Mesobacillus foraminis TaxID=279826 RepID=UPI0018EEA046|nr:peptidylprolyl isomerase [Mesobacillus foraminis]
MQVCLLQSCDFSIIQKMKGENSLRKIISLLLFTTTLLVACNTSILSISEMDTVPSDVHNKVDPDYKLQLITDGEDAAYIVYQSNGTVSTDLLTEGDTLKVKLEEKNKKADVLKNHVYKLTLNPEHEVINVIINGKSVPFDNVASL